MNEKYLEYKNSFAVTFSEFVLASGLTHLQIAERTGFSNASISDWRNGKRTPNIVEVCILADFFEVTVDELTGRKDYK